MSHEDIKALSDAYLSMYSDTEGQMNESMKPYVSAVGDKFEVLDAKGKTVKTFSDMKSAEAYLKKNFDKLREEAEEQINEAAKTAKQISKRADTLSKNISDFENMLKQSKPKGAGKEYDKAVKEVRDAYIDLTDAIDKVERMMK